MRFNSINRQFHCSLSQNVLLSDPSSWQRLHITLRTHSKEIPSYWIWGRRWLNSRTLGWDTQNFL